MELATFIIYHRWFDDISLALFGVTAPGYKFT